ncbi:hypothetical protein AAG570_004973 [Ranatra chinensis]|uniref:Uncharacterized protein n=1 Tax=Ranatra chinensis TaxID=642074 RepID=A0ABD0XZ58_9HEMI
MLEGSDVALDVDVGECCRLHCAQTPRPVTWGQCLRGEEGADTLLLRGSLKNLSAASRNGSNGRELIRQLQFERRSYELALMPFAERLKEFGLKVLREESSFFRPSVKFVGYLKFKVEAIKNLRGPSDAMGQPWGSMGAS